MSKIDLKSKEWCELVFEGRNKVYGAYDLRAKTGRRYLFSLVTILLGGLLIGIGVFTFQKVSKMIEESMKNEDATELAQMEEAVEEEEEVTEDDLVYEEEEVVEEVVEVMNSLEFTVPDIVENANPDSKVTSQETAQESNVTLANVTFTDGTDNQNAKLASEIGDKRAGKETKETTEKKDDLDNAQVFTSVEQMPQFPGGDEALLKYVATHIKYPAIAQEQEVQGKVVLKFVVTEKGTVEDVRIISGLSKECDMEAVRVVKTLPKFIPGKMQGKPVRVWYTLPIRFQLQ